MTRITTTAGVLLATSLVVAGCGTTTPQDGTATPDESPDAPTTDETGTATAGAGEAAGAGVVATTTVLGSVVDDIATCAGGTAETLLPVGADPHDFSPSSDQVARLVEADLVVANGLGLEEGLVDALAGAEADGATVLEVAPLVDPIEFGSGSGHDHGDEHAGDGHDHGEDEHDHGEDGHDHGGDDAGDEHGHGDEHDHGSQDPHFWHDAARMAEAAEQVGGALAEATGDDAYAACGTEVRDALLATDEQVREILAAVPDDRRVLVTDHDAFGYFAAAYDFEVAGVVVPGGSTLAEPSSEELAELVGVVQAEGVPAIFANTADSPALVDAVAAEAGTEIEVVELFVGSVGEPGSGAETYAGLMTTNAQRIADALTAG